jgi:hypothetical protein
MTYHAVRRPLYPTDMPVSRPRANYGDTLLYVTAAALSRSTRGSGPGLRGAKGAAEPALEHCESIPGFPAGGRWWEPARSGSSSPRRSAWREALQNQGSVRATAPPLQARHFHPRAAPECSTMASPRHGSPTRDHRIERDVTGRRQ